MVLSASASASELPATISSNLTLTQAESPYSGSATIKAGATLTVEPGVEFTSGGLTVEGTLDAEGTTGEPIVFGTSSYGGFAFELGSGASVLNHVEINHGGSMYHQAVLIEGSSPRITNSVIRNSTWWGIYIKSGAPEIDHDTVIGSGDAGVIFSQEGGHPGTINIHDNVLEENGGSAALFVGAGEETTATSLGDNTLKHNYSLEAGYYHADESGEVPPDIGSNVLEENKGNYIDISGVLRKSATWQNGAPILPANLTIGKEATLTVEPGTLFRAAGISVKGTLKAEGTAKEPIVFSSDEGGDQYGGITFKPGSGASLLDHVEVDKAGTTYHQAILIEDSSPRITNSVIRGSTWNGISITSGAPEIDHDTIIGSTEAGVAYNQEGGYPGAVDIHDNLFEENGGSAALFVGAGEETTATSLGGNTVKHNKSLEAVYYGGGETGEVPADIGSNVLEENVGNHINISGVLRKSGTWENGAPILPTNLVIGKEATLTLEPGTLFEGGGISVKGTLKAEGTAKEPVVFSREEGYEYGGLFFKSGGGSSLLDHVEIDKAGTMYHQAILIEDSSPRITNSVIRDSTWDGIYIKSGAPEIDHDTIIGSTEEGVIYSQEGGHPGTVNIHDNVIEENGGSAALFVGGGEETTATSLGGNTVKNNHSLEAVYVHDGENGEVPPDICSNVLEENVGNHINLSGVIAKSGSCGAGGYPIFPEGVSIAKGVTWTLGPGLLFVGGNISVKGTLKAEGTAEEPIVFRRNEGREYGGLSFKAGSGASVLSHVEVVGAGPYYGSAISIRDSSPQITHSVIRQSTWYAITVEGGGSPEIDHNTISHTGTIGLYYGSAEGHSGEINVHDNAFEYGYTNGDAPIFVEISGESGENITATSLGNNTIAYNHGGGIYYSGGAIPPDIDENKQVSNRENYTWIRGVLASSATWTDYGYPIQVSSFEVANGATLTATKGLSFEGGTFTVKGTLDTEGTFEEPVVFQPQDKSSWGGLVFEPGSGSSVIQGAEVIQGGSGGWGSASAIKINGSSPTITYSTLRESPYQAILVKEGSPVIEYDLFRDNPYGLIYEGKSTLYAPNNDWECNPESKSCSAVSGKVEWEPTAALAKFEPPCVAGSAHPGPRLDCLLYRYEPELRLDSEEDYEPASAAEITENWGDENGLWREDAKGDYANSLRGVRFGELGEHEIFVEELGRAGPRYSPWFSLKLDTLGATYPDSEEASPGDWIDEVNPEEESYSEVASELESRGNFEDHAYGILKKDGSGKIWLQYWYFYYYDSFGPGTAGDHEGDWESVEIGLDEELKPEVVVYSQHKNQIRCYVEDEDEDERPRMTESGAPIVFVAKGSHANYPDKGDYETEGGEERPDGEGSSLKPPLEDLGRTKPSWLEWPGHWGSSSGGSPIESTSPPGPAFHPIWDSPDGEADSAELCYANSPSHGDRRSPSRALRASRQLRE